MAASPINTVIRNLRNTILAHDAKKEMTDGQLLESFIAGKDEAAFAALMRRHGGMVQGVCRRVLHNRSDAEDAFQATFLVLVRKASSVRPREMVGNWLHGVAYRTALKGFNEATAKRSFRERQMTRLPENQAKPDDYWRDLQPVLDEELNRLPENYRLPILLCDLEGMSIKQATLRAWLAARHTRRPACQGEKDVGEAIDSARHRAVRRSIGDNAVGKRSYGVGAIDAKRNDQGRRRHGRS